jgi:uroporphyrinogen-III synthase
MRLLVTRPGEDAAALIALLEVRGHQPVAAPVMAIRPIPGATVDLKGVQALLVTSRNGVRALTAATDARALPVLAVGAGSAAAARAAGFAAVASAEGDVAALARLVKQRLRPEAGLLLHACGSVQAGDLAGMLAAAGYGLRRAVLYEARPLARLSAEAEAFLRGKTRGGVLFYSPRTVQLFGALAEGFPLTAQTAYCLSEAVAETARRLGFGGIAVAARPEQEALLSLIPLEPKPDPS